MVSISTPVQNNLKELWALFHWLYPEIFTTTTSGLFHNSFDPANGRINSKVLDDARRLLELVMLRRLKSSATVDLNLPPKKEVLLYVPLTPLQRLWYTRLLTRSESGLLEQLFRDVKTKELAALTEEREEEKKLSKVKVEADADEEIKGGWRDFKAAKNSIIHERSQETGSPAWKKLMNLLMQLRKVNNPIYQSSRAPADVFSAATILISCPTPSQKTKRWETT
jgi:SNF2 family DNA or RNA helicase